MRHEGGHFLDHFITFLKRVHSELSRTMPPAATRDQNVAGNSEDSCYVRFA